MSNEYKDWVCDKITEIVLNKGILEYTTYYTMADDGSYYLLGFKRDKWKGCRVWLDADEGWQCEEVETDPYLPTQVDLSYKAGWRKGYACAQAEAQDAYAKIIMSLHDTIDELRTELLVTRNG